MTRWRVTSNVELSLWWYQWLIGFNVWHYHWGPALHIDFGETQHRTVWNIFFGPLRIGNTL